MKTPVPKVIVPKVTALKASARRVPVTPIHARLATAARRRARAAGIRKAQQLLRAVKQEPRAQPPLKLRILLNLTAHMVAAASPR